MRTINPFIYEVKQFFIIYHSSILINSSEILSKQDCPWTFTCNSNYGSNSEITGWISVVLINLQIIYQ